MNLAQRCRVLQELIFQATIRGTSNWIRFPVNSKLHIMIARGKVKGISLYDIKIIGDLVEIRTR